MARFLPRTFKDKIDGIKSMLNLLRGIAYRDPPVTSTLRPFREYGMVDWNLSKHTVERQSKSERWVDALGVFRSRGKGWTIERDSNQPSR